MFFPCFCGSYDDEERCSLESEAGLPPVEMGETWIRIVLSPCFFCHWSANIFDFIEDDMRVHPLKGNGIHHSCSPEQLKGAFYMENSDNLHLIKPEVRDGAISMAKRILATYPPNAYCYIAIGRSPALVAAYLKSKDYLVFTVPLTEFRHGVGNHECLSVDKEKALTRHFSKYLPTPAVIGQRDIVIIEFCMHGDTAVAAYNYIHRYYLGKLTIRPVGEAFGNDSEVSDLWDYEETTGKGIQNLQIFLAVMGAEDNKTILEGKLKGCCQEDDDAIDEELGRMFRLQPDLFTVFAPQPQNKDEGRYIGSMDNELLKRFAEFGKQEESITVSKKDYRDLVNYFTNY